LLVIVGKPEKEGRMIGALIAKKALAKAFEAMNRHDLKKFMSAWHDDAAFIYPGDIPESGTFQGKSAVEGWFKHFFEQFPKIHFDLKNICVRNIFDLLGNNVAAVNWDIELENREGRVGRNSGVTLLTIKRGKVVLVKDFIFDLGDNFRRNWSAV
jgi:ketosteroid isomerase-like protein